MQTGLQSRSPLLRLLMVLEWMLLGILAIAQLVVALVNGMPMLLISNGIGLGMFAAMGLRMPQTPRTRLMYTLAEFGIIFYLAFWGNIPLSAILFLVLVIRNCVLWQGTPRVIVTVLAFIGCILSRTQRLLTEDLLFKIPVDQIGNVWIGFFLIFGLMILFLHLLVDAALKEHQGQVQLAATNLRLQEYALRIEELATAQERNRIARDLHDSLGHSLTVFSIHLEAALRLLHSNPAQTEVLLQEIKQLNTNTFEQVRQSVTALRTDPLQGRSLCEAIADLIAEFQSSTGLLPQSTIQLKHPLSHGLNITIFRIVQESLTNIRKYARATHVSVAIIESVSDLQVTVTDNGQGFDLDHNTTGFGLQGMRERTLALAGQLEIMTAPDQGCCIQARFSTAQSIRS
jgi:signal transduction histidine kinase